MRYKSKHNLLRWFIEDHRTLPKSYVKSCEKFFRELGEERGKLQAIDETVPYNDIEEAQAASSKLDSKLNKG